MNWPASRTHHHLAVSTQAPGCPRLQQVSAEERLELSRTGFTTRAMIDGPAVLREMAGIAPEHLLESVSPSSVGSKV
eukprot:CAMPEP_0119378656 /NCGR_PEP_ID=MMETSP1334-20130426/49266_1 /TAXON_ID=127549 /ORGANISM="Calcidiscus leptoporus, Strain RCC1130" /LENGTH=76 /DNA_ID=CAMNT_0007397939 /DNA_START=87 /DNA_END=317 /DNA_ORIENTATION=+